ncbi:MAG: hypothetical protein U0840_12500 [Gemmataceae bacterium]
MAGHRSSWLLRDDNPRSDDFEKHVRPLLVEKWQSCHGPEKAKGGLRLDTRTPVGKYQSVGFGLTAQHKDGTLATSYSYRGDDDKTHLEVVRWKLPAAKVVGSLRRVLSRRAGLLVRVFIRTNGGKNWSGPFDHESQSYRTLVDCNSMTNRCWSIIGPQAVPQILST